MIQNRYGHPDLTFAIRRIRCRTTFTVLRCASGSRNGIRSLRVFLRRLRLRCGCATQAVVLTSETAQFLPLISACRPVNALADIPLGFLTQVEIDCAVRSNSSRQLFGRANRSHQIRPDRVERDLAASGGMAAAEALAPALSRWQRRSLRGHATLEFQAAVAASRHVLIAAARNVRCVEAEVRWRWTLKVLKTAA
jgi:hypothetical protein